MALGRPAARTPLAACVLLLACAPFRRSAASSESESAGGATAAGVALDGRPYQLTQFAVAPVDIAAYDGVAYNDDVAHDDDDAADGGVAYDDAAGDDEPLSVNSSWCSGAYSCAARSLRGSGDAPSGGCSCHRHCRLFGDCCADSEASGGGGGGDEARRYVRGSYVCYSYDEQSADVGDGGWGVYMVSSCPDGYEGRLAKAFCRHSLAGPNKTDSLSTPVTDPVSGVTYRNVYCAVCNGRRPEAVAQWRWKYTCTDHRVFSDPESARNETRQSASLTRDEILERVSQSCQLHYEPPLAAENSVQRCVVNLVDDCSDGGGGAASVTLRSSCRDGPFRIVYASDGSRAFKNEHCAACSLDEPHQLHCWRPQTAVYASLPFSRYAAKASFSFDVILTPGTSQCSSNIATGSESLCDAFAACGAGAGGCSSIACPRGRAAADGACLAWDASLNCSEESASAASAEGVAAIAARRDDARGEFVEDVLVVHYRDGDEARSHCFLCRAFATYDNFTLLPNDSLGLAVWPHVVDRPLYVVSGDAATAKACLLHAAAPAAEHASRGCSYIPEELTLALLLVSEASLVVYFVLFALLSQLRSFSGKMVANQAAAFFVGFLLFLLRPLADRRPLACVALAASAHYCFLAAFAWTSLYAVEIVRALSFERLRGHAPRRLAAYAFAGWGAPALLVGAALAADAAELGVRPSYGPPQCFIGSRSGSRAFFVAPLCVLLCVDVSVYCAMVVKLARLARVTAPARRAHGEKLRLCCQLLLSLGFVWLLAVVAALVDEPVAYCLFSAVNSLQGLFVLLIFAGKRRVCGSLFGSIRSVASQLTASTSAADGRVKQAARRSTDASV